MYIFCSWKLPINNSTAIYICMNMCKELEEQLNVPYSCLVYCSTLCLQGPYDVMLHGCDSVQGGTTLRTLVTDVNLPNATFSQKLPEFLAVTSTSYLWHAVSVQTSTGTILGCGRLETLFSVEGSYNKSNTFSQFSPFLPTTLKDVSNIDILKHNILDGISGTCSKKSTIFDPWSPPVRQVGTITTADQFPVGDLPNHVLEVLSLLPEVPLIGSATVLGHVVSHGLQTVQLTYIALC